MESFKKLSLLVLVFGCSNDCFSAEKEVLSAAIKAKEPMKIVFNDGEEKFYAEKDLENFGFFTGASRFAEVRGNEKKVELQENKILFELLLTLAGTEKESIKAAMAIEKLSFEDVLELVKMADFLQLTNSSGNNRRRQLAHILIKKIKDLPLEQRIQLFDQLKPYFGLNIMSEKISEIVPVGNPIQGVGKVIISSDEALMLIKSNFEDRHCCLCRIVTGVDGIPVIKPVEPNLFFSRSSVEMDHKGTVITVVSPRGSLQIYRIIRIIVEEDKKIIEQDIKIVPIGDVIDNVDWTKISSDGSVVAVRGRDRTLRLFKIKDDERQRIFLGDALEETLAEVSCVELSADGTVAVVIHENKDLKIYKIVTEGDGVVRVNLVVGEQVVQQHACRAHIISDDGSLVGIDFSEGGPVPNNYFTQIHHLATDKDGKTRMSAIGAPFDHVIRVQKIYSDNTMQLLFYQNNTFSLQLYKPITIDGKVDLKLIGKPLPNVMSIMPLSSGSAIAMTEFNNSSGGPISKLYDVSVSSACTYQYIMGLKMLLSSVNLLGDGDIMAIKSLSRLQFYKRLSLKEAIELIVKKSVELAEIPVPATPAPSMFSRLGYYIGKMTSLINPVPF